MRAFRTLLSAITILAGATLVVLWLVSWVAIRAVEDGSATESIVVVALKNPAVVDKIGVEVKDNALAALADRGIDLDVWGVGDAAAASISDLVGTAEFRDSVLEQLQAAREELHDELTAPDRALSPFDIQIDTSDLVNDRIDGVTGATIDVPNVTVAPVRIEVVSADTFEKARTGYARMEFAKRFFLWAGLALIALGMIVSTRKRWVLAKFLAAVAVFSLGAYVALVWIGPDRIASWLPGGADGGWGSVFGDVIAKEALPAVTGNLLLASGIALVGAAVAALFGYVAGGERR
ncbi:MAG: hypothetical protein CVT68_05170 [Actinobacteria bacterium HGW-Actinobacteria-8]|nr:MAG: hypothetical protein CVT68_05170 [Actinobacteria bacterium HGW-Actinobacteria-8]